MNGTWKRIERLAVVAQERERSMVDGLATENQRRSVS